MPSGPVPAITAPVHEGEFHENELERRWPRSPRWHSQRRPPAQDWPTRPITLIVPFAAGGGVDASARLQALAIGEILGQTVVVENVGAAAGTVGSGRVAKATPDGYTMLIGNSGTHAYSQSLYKRKPYDTLTDFEPVGIVTELPRILIARKGLPVNNLQELVAYMKANQAKMQYSSAGVGSGTHLPCALLNHTLGVNITMVPYRGEGPALQDVVADRMDYMCTTIQSGAVQARDGTVKGIAVMAPRRAAIIPNLATTGEQGVKGVEATVWNGFFFPRGTPKPIVEKMHRTVEAVVSKPEMRQKMEVARPRNPAARAAHAGLYGEVHERRHRALGQGDPGRRHQRGLISLSCPGCGAARSEAKRCAADPGPFQTPNLARSRVCSAATSCCAAPGTRASQLPQNRNLRIAVVAALDLLESVRRNELRVRGFLNNDQRVRCEPSAVARGQERLFGQALAVGRIEQRERERRQRRARPEPRGVAAIDLARAARAQRVDIAAQQRARFRAIVDEQHEGSPARQRLQSHRAGSGEQVEHPRPAHRIAVGMLEDIEQRLAQPV